MPITASGSFDVTLTPQTLEHPANHPLLGRLLIDKQFYGDLEAVSQGQMLSANTGVQGSAGYVAIERVKGQLCGWSGTFVLQHSGTITRGASQLSITVVPDSGTDQLTGLTGQMEIIITNGQHSYNFTYSLPEAA